MVINAKIMPVEFHQRCAEGHDYVVAMIRTIVFEYDDGTMTYLVDFDPADWR